MTNAPADPTAPKVLRRLSMHLKMSGGSIYSHDLLDEAGKVIGGISSFVSSSKKRASSTTYFLGKREFATSEEWFAAYRSQLEQEKRDQEWADAAPKEETPDGN